MWISPQSSKGYAVSYMNVRYLSNYTLFSNSISGSKTPISKKVPRITFQIAIKLLEQVLKINESK